MMADATSTTCSLTYFVARPGNSFPQTVRLTADSTVLRDAPAVWVHVPTSTSTCVVSPRLWLSGTGDGLLVRVLGVWSQRRVVAVQVHTDRVLALPLDCQDRFQVRDGRNRTFVLKKYRTLEKIASHHDLPLLVDHKPVCSSSSSKTPPRKRTSGENRNAKIVGGEAALGTLMLKEVRDVCFMALNFIRNGTLDDAVGYLILEERAADDIQVDVIMQTHQSVVPQSSDSITIQLPSAAFDVTIERAAISTVHQAQCDGSHRPPVKSSSIDASDDDDVSKQNGGDVTATDHDPSQNIANTSTSDDRASAFEVQLHPSDEEFRSSSDHLEDDGVPRRPGEPRIATTEDKLVTTRSSTADSDSDIGKVKVTASTQGHRQRSHSAVVSENEAVSREINSASRASKAEVVQPTVWNCDAAAGPPSQRLDSHTSIPPTRTADSATPESRDDDVTAEQLRGGRPVTSSRQPEVTSVMRGDVLASSSPSQRHFASGSGFSSLQRHYHCQLSSDDVTHASRSTSKEPRRSATMNDRSMQQNHQRARTSKRSAVVAFVGNPIEVVTERLHDDDLSRMTSSGRATKTPQCRHGNDVSTNRQPSVSGHVTGECRHAADGRALIQVEMPRTSLVRRRDSRPEARRRSDDKRPRDVISCPIQLKIRREPKVVRLGQLGILELNANGAVVGPARRCDDADLRGLSTVPRRPVNDRHRRPSSAADVDTTDWDKLSSGAEHRSHLRSRDHSIPEPETVMASRRHDTTSFRISDDTFRRQQLQRRSMSDFATFSRSRDAHPLPVCRDTPPLQTPEVVRAGDAGARLHPGPQRTENVVTRGTGRRQDDGLKEERTTDDAHRRRIHRQMNGGETEPRRAVADGSVGGRTDWTKIRDATSTSRTRHGTTFTTDGRQTNEDFTHDSVGQATSMNVCAVAEGRSVEDRRPSPRITSSDSKAWNLQPRGAAGVKATRTAAVPSSSQIWWPYLGSESESDSGSDCVHTDHDDDGENWTPWHDEVDASVEESIRELDDFLLQQDSEQI